MENKKIIEELSRYLGISVKQIAEKVGISATTLYEIQRGRIETISPKLAKRITENWPEISEYWLRTGVGPMLIGDRNNINVSENAAAVIQSPNAVTTINAAAMDEIKATMLFQRDEINRLIGIVDKLLDNQTPKSNGNEQ